jgi:hypothetical protein
VRIVSMPPTRRKAAPPASSPVEVKLRRVAPVIPDSEPERAALMEDLNSMGCTDFILKPWGFKDDQVVRELLGERCNAFDGTIRADPGKWTEKVWRDVYRIRPGGMGMASRKDDYIRGKFRGAVNPKDGYAIEDCASNRNRRLLEFLLPILHPEKPTRVTITLANTIFGSLSGDRKVDWGRIIHDLVSQLVGRVGKSRASPLCPYLFHLYKHEELLTGPEEEAWNHQEKMIQYGESESGDEDEPESGSESDSDEEDCRVTSPPPKRPRVVSPPKEKGEKPVSEPGTSSRPKPQAGSQPKSFVGFGDPVKPVFDALVDLKADLESKNQVLIDVATVIGARPDRNLAAKVAECIADPVELERQQVEIRELREELKEIKAELLLAREESAVTRGVARDLALVANRIKDTLGAPGEAVAKALLFDSKILEENKISGSRLVKIFSDGKASIGAIVNECREAAERITESTRKLLRGRDPREIRLSDVSLPDEFPDVALTGEFAFSTPDSKKKTGGVQTRNLTREFTASRSGTKSPKSTPPGRTSRRIDD